LPEAPLLPLPETVPVVSALERSPVEALAPVLCDFSRLVETFVSFDRRTPLRCSTETPPDSRTLVRLLTDTLGSELSVRIVRRRLTETLGSSTTRRLWRTTTLEPFFRPFTTTLVPCFFAFTTLRRLTTVLG
jgi:hypothetical protein